MLGDGFVTENNLKVSERYVTKQYWTENVMGEVFYEAGGLWSWGYNNSGQLGQGDLVHRSSPVQVGSLTNWKLIYTTDYNSLAIKTDGTLWTWGASGGALLTSSSSPIQVGSLTNWKEATIDLAGSCSAIKTDGTLWSWGSNSNGQLGDGTRTSTSSPIQIGTGQNWKLIYAGRNSRAAIKTDGTLWAWGNNTNGQLGQGNLVHRSSPVQVGSLTNWKSIFGGDSFTTAIKTDGTLWAWGDNSSGKLGLGDLISRSSPVQIGTLTNWKSASNKNNFTQAIKIDGTLWSWGLNSKGQLGDGTVVSKSSPIQIGTLTDWKIISQTSGTFSEVSGNSQLIKTDGTLWAWGENYWGQLGLGDLVHRSSPVQVGSLTNWKNVSSGATHTLAIK